MRELIPDWHQTVSPPIGAGAVISKLTDPPSWYGSLHSLRLAGCGRKAQPHATRTQAETTAGAVRLRRRSRCLRPCRWFRPAPARARTRAGGHDRGWHQAGGGGVEVGEPVQDGEVLAAQPGHGHGIIPFALPDCRTIWQSSARQAKVQGRMLDGP